MAEAKKKMQALVQVEKISTLLKTSEKDSKDLLKKPEELLRKVREAAAKLRRIRSGPFMDSIKEFTLISEMVQAYVKGEYTKIPVKSIVASVAMLLYFLNPLDVIPDVLPGIGYIDDAFVVSKVVKLIHSDLNDFRKWKISH